MPEGCLSGCLSGCHGFSVSFSPTLFLVAEGRFCSGSEMFLKVLERKNGRRGMKVGCLMLDFFAAIILVLVYDVVHHLLLLVSLTLY